MDCGDRIISYEMTRQLQNGKTDWPKNLTLREASALARESLQWSNMVKVYRVCEFAHHDGSVTRGLTHAWIITNAGVEYSVWYNWPFKRRTIRITGSVDGYS